MVNQTHKEMLLFLLMETRAKEKEQREEILTKSTAGKLATYVVSSLGGLLMG